MKKFTYAPLGNVSALGNIAYELDLNRRFIKRDLLAIVLPGCLFTLRALMAQNHSLLTSLGYLSMAFLYFWLVLSFFCISNQIVGVDEDRKNKPDRPLPAGLISLDGALLRFAIYGILGVFLGAFLEILEFTALFYLATVLNNFGRMGDHWFFKNVLTAVGIFSTIAAGWNIGAEFNPQICAWLAVLGGMWLLLGSVQDLRDIEGDRIGGRVTFPIAFGERAARYSLAFGFVCFPIAIYWGLLMPLAMDFVVVGWMGAFCVLNLVIAYRTVFLRTPEQDTKTYMLFLILFCALIISMFYLM